MLGETQEPPAFNEYNGFKVYANEECKMSQDGKYYRTTIIKSGFPGFDNKGKSELYFDFTTDE